MAVKLEDVFIAGGQPTITYVNRDHLGLEVKLKKALSKGYSIISVTGLTKCGKSVLCKTVIPANEAIWIDGGQVGSLSGLMDQIIFEENIPSEISKAQQNEVTTTGKALFAEVGGKKSETVTQKWNGPDIKKALGAVRKSSRKIVIDDFHYIDQKVQLEIVRALKSEIFEGLRLVLISVPHRAFDVIRVESEMEGRFVHIEVPQWDSSDLKKIVNLGADALNVEFGDFEIFACNECFGNPLLMQSICSDYCAENNVFGHQERKQTLHYSLDVATRIMRDIAANAGYPTFRKLRSGPQQRSKRNLHVFKNGSSGDIYEAILTAIARTGPKKELSYDEIRVALRDLLKNDVPQKHEVTRALSQMSGIAAQKEGEPALEWVGQEDSLHITDPFLMCYMRWLPDTQIGQGDS